MYKTLKEIRRDEELLWELDYYIDYCMDSPWRSKIHSPFTSDELHIRAKYAFESTAVQTQMAQQVNYRMQLYVNELLLHELAACLTYCEHADWLIPRELETNPFLNPHLVSSAAAAFADSVRLYGLRR